MARERVEDLGRLSVMLRNVLFERSLYKLGYAGGLRGGRPKDACDIFFALPQERQRHILRELACALENVERALHECLSIADGTAIQELFRSIV